MSKIAFYISTLRHGGSERVVVNLAEGFNKAGYEVIVVTTYKKTKEPEFALSSEIKRILSEPEAEKLKQGKKITDRLYNLRLRINSLKDIWKKEKPDVIVSFVGKNNFFAIISGAGLKIPVIACVRGNPSSEYPGKISRFIANSLFKRASGVVFQTEEARSFFDQSIYKKSAILPNPLNEDFIRQVYEGERKREVVAVGTLDFNKNQAMLIEAFDSVATEYTEWRLIIYGEGKEAGDYLRNLVNGKNNKNRMTMFGECDNIPEAIGQSAIYVMTSNTEGSPNALIEAMSLGLACISTDCPCGGPRELIENGKNGMLVPVGDTEALKAGLIRLMEDGKLRSRLGNNASKVQEIFAPDVVLSKWQGYIESILEE